ncbi:lipid-A-disaccharide synthase [Rhodalgimonas zhirmunskyi]|uniref:Lipid-A-disaccharide synthase n=1 Tax=Rhodalgimonas zhirmunskyi TaxID=2964767 RepID=A0AAJ1X5Y6_9RHOB|nr:lipid-A-disaccharide synthase [Rhodoalgimonas zhirmunskyi]MDQ2092872.1 lipid-A-disaccharide synthase [Rhodoalgimonas zhirmunskyi]
MRVYLVAGEMSGDALGAALMAGLKSLAPEAVFKGVGGADMCREGLETLFPMEELSLMGIAEVLPSLRHLLRRRDEVVADVLAWKPDVLITIDSPDFGLRVARKVRERCPDIRTVHYVAPTVWAWRPGRATKMARYIDHVLALFPFEPPYMEAAGMDCDFVGHPVVSAKVASEHDAMEFRAAHGISGEMLLVLPGSRSGEASRLLGRFGAAVRQIVEARPGLRVVVPAALPVAGMVGQEVRRWAGDPVILDPREMKPDVFEASKRAAFSAADGALAASGTVSLELAANDTPMIIGYDMGWISRQIIPRMLKIDTFTLVNLVSETRAVPEFIGKACRAPAIAQAVCKMLDEPDTQREALRLTLERLGKGGEAPGLRAARAVLKRL